MNQNEFIEETYKDLKSAKIFTNKDQAKQTIDIVLNNMRNAVAKGLPLSLQNFGTFSSRIISRRNMADPKGPRLNNWEVKFASSKSLKDEMNGK